MGDCILFILIPMLLGLIPLIAHVIKVFKGENHAWWFKLLILLATLSLSLPAMQWFMMGMLITNNNGGYLPTEKLINLVFLIGGILSSLGFVVLIWDALAVTRRKLVLGWLAIWLLSNLPTSLLSYDLLNQHAGDVVTSVLSPDKKKQANYAVEWFLFSGNGWIQIESPPGSWFQYRIPSNAPSVETTASELKIYWTQDSEGIVLIRTHLYAADESAEALDFYHYPIEVWFFDYSDTEKREYTYLRLTEIASFNGPESDLSTPETIINGMANWVERGLDLPGIAYAYDQKLNHLIFIKEFMHRHGSLSEASVTWSMDPSMKAYAYDEEVLRDLIETHEDHTTTQTSNKKKTDSIEAQGPVQP